MREGKLYYLIVIVYSHSLISFSLLHLKRKSQLLGVISASITLDIKKGLLYAYCCNDLIFFLLLTGS